HRSHRSATAADVRASRIGDDARSQWPAHDARIVQGFGKKSAFASSVAPGHHDRRCPLRQQQPLSHIVLTDRGKRPVPPPRFRTHYILFCVHRIVDAKPVPIWTDLPEAGKNYFFSITHCRGCWCLRAKSITCVTLVSAISKVKAPHSPTPLWWTWSMISRASSATLLKNFCSTWMTKSIGV